MILDEGTLSLENGSFLIELKENITLIKKFGPMYLNFDGYRPYSDAIFENVEINVNANIQCDNGYAYSSSKEKIFTWINEESWEIMQTYFPDAKGLKKPPKITRCKKCEYIQNERNQVYKSFDLTPDYAHTFSTSYFHEEPILDVSTI